MKTAKKSTIFAMTLLLLTGCGSKTAGELTNGLPSDRAPASATAGAASRADAGEMKDDAFGGEEAAGAAAAVESAADRADADDFRDAKAYAAEGGEELGFVEEAPEAKAPERTPPEQNPGGEPFVLTAGEWNDNENWGFFANLVHNGTIAFPSYGLDPTGRVAVTVTHDGAAVRNQAVTLRAEGTQIWEATTDQSGTAYLFYDAKTYGGQTLTVETADAELMQIKAPDARNDGQGTGSLPTFEVHLETDADARSFDQTQVMFILDTTGSMGDEISYLQKDFSAIAEEVASENITFSVNFYRDEGDMYVTRCNPFTTDIQSLQRMLNAEFADGGGDTPEAVAEILDETMHSADWQADTNKIAFLIFDAPPHDGAEREQKISGAVGAAAEQGIHLVPVVASNAARETELFGRALSIMTNSNYVFLTDDSGVGGAHLEPIIGDYDVELLHDIIVRNIREIAG